MDVVVPAQFVIYCHTEVFAVCFILEDMAMKLVVEQFWGFLPGYSEDTAFLWVEFHLPLLLPGCQVVEVLLEGSGILVVGYCQVHDGVICEQSYPGADLFWKIVDVDQEQYWPDDRALWHSAEDWGML